MTSLLTVAEAAAITRLSERTIRMMITDGRLAVIRPKGLRIVRVPRSAVLAMLGHEVLDTQLDPSVVARRKKRGIRCGMTTVPAESSERSGGG